MNEPLPPGWTDVQLGALGSFSRGRGGTKIDELSNGYPVIRYGEIYTQHDYIIRAFHAFIAPERAASYAPLKSGNVVFAGSGETLDEIGKAATYSGPGPAYAGPDTIIFRPNQYFDSQFAGYAVNSQVAARFKGRMGQGSSVMHISPEHLARMPVALPPLSEQRGIAQILTATADAIEETRVLIAKTKQIRAGLVDDLFSRGVLPNGVLRPSQSDAPSVYRESIIGPVPKEWIVATIGDLFTRRADRGRPGLPVMAITADRGLVPRHVMDRKVETNLSAEAHLLVREGDVAYNMMRMWQGVLGRAEYDCLVSPAYVVVSPSERIESHFGLNLLSTPAAIAWYKRRSYGVVDDRLRLYPSDLLRIPVALPSSLAEQLAITEQIRVIDESLHGQSASLNKLRQQRQGLMQDLLTGGVRVAALGS